MGDSHKQSNESEKEKEIMTNASQATQTTQHTNARVDRLDFVSLQVAQIEESKRFYHEFLGFALSEYQQPDAVVFETPEGSAFAIRKPLVDLKATDKLGWGVGLWFGANDVDSIHKKALEQGIRVVGEPKESPFGRTVMLVDPDGYTITLHNN